MNRVTVGANSLNVIDIPGPGIPLLFVHGFPLDHSMWQPQIEFFGERQRVIVPDLRGFGQSAPAGDTVTMEQFADDLAGLLDALHVTEKIVFVGLSMGGYIGWQFWKKYSARLAGLIQCDTRAIADTAEAAANRRQLAERVLREGSGCVAEAMLPKLFSPGVASTTLAQTRQVMLHNPPAGIAAALRGMAVRPDVTDWLPQIELPTLLVVGESDVISPPAEMEGLAEVIPDAAWLVVPQAGHMAPLENPKVFNEAVEEFLML